MESFTWGETQSVSPIESGKSKQASVSMRDLEITAALSSASPLLMSFCAAGKPLKAATLVYVKTAGTTSKVFLTIELTDVYISNYDLSGNSGTDGDDVPRDRFSLRFGKIEFRFTGDKADSSPGKNTTGSWDLRTGLA